MLVKNNFAIKCTKIISKHQIPPLSIMPRNSRKKNTMNKPTKKRTFGPGISERDLTRFEFHRQALALMPDPEDKDPGVAVMVDDEGPALDFLNCNCAKSRKTTCTHIKKLDAVYRFNQSMLGE